MRAESSPPAGYGSVSEFIQAMDVDWIGCRLALFQLVWPKVEGQPFVRLTPLAHGSEFPDQAAELAVSNSMKAACEAFSLMLAGCDDGYVYEFFDADGQSTGKGSVIVDPDQEED